MNKTPEKPIFNILEPLYLIGTAALWAEIFCKIIDTSLIDVGVMFIFIYPTGAAILLTVYRWKFNRYCSLLIFGFFYFIILFLALFISFLFPGPDDGTPHTDNILYWIMFFSHLLSLLLSFLLSSKWKKFKNKIEEESR